MKNFLTAFLSRYTFKRQLGITVTFGILLLALLSSVVSSWQNNERARRNILNQSQLITENMARQSALALIYASGENAATAANATMAFPDVISVEVLDTKQQVLLERNNHSPHNFPVLSARTSTMIERPNNNQDAAFLYEENENAWRFVAPVYSQPTGESPFSAQASTPELLGYVAVVVSKAALTRATAELFATNLITSLSFAVLFLLMIYFLTNRMTRPLNQLSASMKRAESGESQVRAISAGPKDIADMAHAFNSMMSVMEEREAALRIAAIAFESQEGMLITDSNNLILRVNRAFTSITGYMAEEVIGKNPQILSTDHHDKDLFTAIWKNINMTGAWEGEIWNRRKNGEPYPEYLTITAVKDPTGKVANYVYAFYDITERKKAEAAFAANRAKSEFLANMSHEIRTPMNGVIGMLDILQQTELEPKQMRMINTIQDSSLALLNILNDILDFSKIEAGKLEIERMPTMLREVSEGAAQLMFTAADTKSVELYVYVSPQIPLWVAADPLRLRQILLNLLGNAVKFTSTEEGKTGRVELRAELTTLADGRPGIQLRVIDNGIGMSPETQAKLFQPFTQADESTSRKFGGTGLGLSITHRLIEMMGGKILLHSELGMGSEFTVLLPLEESPPGRPLTAGPNLTDVNILAVTGNALCAEILTDYCSAAGAKVMIVPDLAAANLQLQEMTRSQLKNMQPPPSVTALLLDVDVPTETGPHIPDSIRVIQLVRRGKGPTFTKAVTVYARPLLYHDLIQGVAIACDRTKTTDSATLPERRRQPRVSTLTIEEALAANRLILLAEDNETNREVIREQLRLLGYTAEVAEDGAVALNMWRTGRYALLLTDCHMPNMDGFELTAVIRAEEQSSMRKPIIAITANALQGEAERCIKHGMSDYLSKPLRLSELDTMLNKWLPSPEITAAESIATHSNPKSDNLSLDPAEFPVWNPDTLTKMVGNNPAMHRRLLEKFLISAQNQVDTIQSAASTGDPATICKVAHAFKSAARTVGAMQLGELCHEMEIAGKADNIQYCRALAERLNSVFEAAAEQISQTSN